MCSILLWYPLIIWQIQITFNFQSRDFNQKREWFWKQKTASISLATGFCIYFSLFFLSRKFKKNYEIPDKINSHICYLRKFSSGGQIWPAKKPYTTRFNWAWNINSYEGQLYQKLVWNWVSNNWKPVYQKISLFQSNQSQISSVFR